MTPKPEHPSNRRKALLTLAAVTVLVVLFVMMGRHWIGVAEQQTQTGTATIGGPFELVNHEGETVTEADFAGKYMLIYFGYSYCPDVCPTSLADMAQALDAIGGKASRVQPLFITVDPERDTPEVLADYVGHFHDRLVGLTGTTRQVKKVLSDYGVFAQRAPVSDESEPYLLDHASIFYIMGPEARFITHVSHGAGAEAIAAKLESVL